MLKRAYVDLTDGRQTHYCRAGAGEPLVLLHPSPLSSAWLEPVIEAVRGRVDAIAPDTPGYGASDPLPEPGHDGGGQLAEPREGLGPYVEWLVEFVRGLGFERVGLYGSATGAQIAVEFARVHPQATRFLVLDNLAHFTADERERMLARYFPDLAPRADGRHLKAAWSMVTGFGQWFPWYERNEEHRIGPRGSVPAYALQRMLVDHLRAGPDYARAYRAALRNEDAARVQAVTVPVRIIRWQGSVLRRYADRLDDFDWPTHIRMVACGPSMDERLLAICSALDGLSGPTAGDRAAGGA